MEVDPETMSMSFESVSTENSGEISDGEAQNRNYVPCGVGVTVQQTDEGFLKVLGVVNGSDLNVGDLLLTINGQVVHGKPKEEVASLLQGRAGSSVIVDVRRSGMEQPVRVKLTRHYKAKKGATRQRRGNGARTPTSPGRGSGAAGFSSKGVPTPPSSHGSAPPPALQRPVLDQSPQQASTEQSFDPEASMRSDKSFDPEKQVSMQFSHLSGKSYDPERLSSRSDQSYDPELITIQRSATARQQKPTAAPLGKSSNPSLRPGSFQSSEQSFDPESRPKSFDPSEQSFDPESRPKSFDPSEQSFDPESRPKSFDPSEQSFDPESRPTSASQPHAPRFNPGVGFSLSKSPPSNSAGNELSVDSVSDRRAAAALDSMSTLLRQAIQGKVVPGISSQELKQQQIPGRGMPSTSGADAALSLTPPSKRGAQERSFASDRSFDPDSSRLSPPSRANQSIMSYASEASYDPEASRHMSPPTSSGKPSFNPSEVSFDPENYRSSSMSQAGGGVRASFASEASFDPERGSSYAASLERRDGGGGMSDQPSFDPSQSSMFLQGPEYDPSVDFRSVRAPSGKAWGFDQASFDPERSEIDPEASPPTSNRVSRRMTGRSNESFDPEATSEVDPDEYGYQSRGSSMRGGGHDSRPRSVWGASVGVVLEEKGRRFFISSTRGQQAGAAVSVGDELVAVDGLNLHGMALGEVNEVLAGPEGSIAELEVRRESAGGKIIRTPLNRISTAGAGGGILAGGVATLPPRRPAASTGGLAGEAEKRAREEGAREERIKREHLESEVAQRDEMIRLLRSQVQQAADFNEQAALAEEAKDKQLKEARDTIAQMQADALAAKSKGLVGIGVDLTRRVDGAYEVSSVAGGGGGGLIHAGLVVLSVGGVTVFGMEEIEVAALIKGEHGTTVTLEVGNGSRVWRVEMKRNETATPRESERGSEQGESSARLAQLQALVMGLTRQVERKEEEEDTLRRTLELREMQMESALSTLGRVENLTDQLAQSLGATGSVGKGWETALEGIALAAEAALADARLLKAKQAAGGGAEEGTLLEALKTLILDLQRCEGAAFDKVLSTRVPRILEGTEVFSLLRELLTDLEARQNKFANSSDRAQYAAVQHQRSVRSQRSRGRMHRNRSGSSLGAGASSFDPSDYGEDSSDDDDGDGRIRRNRSFKAMSTRSELSFDPSVYAGDYDDDEFEGMEEECGIGASLRAGDDGRAVVIGLVNRGPAQRSGSLNVGDIILRIDGVDASNRTHSDLVDMIMGPPGSMVELEVEEEGSGSRATVEIKRETTARREAGMAQRSEMSFDPTEFGGSDSDSEEGGDSDDGGGGDYGIGVKVSKDERGFFRITEVVLGGAADIGGLLKVGDIVRSVGGKTVTVDLRRSDVMDLIRGQPGTIVSVEYVRDGKIHKADVQRDSEEGNGAWRMLSEYSFAHPEEFADESETGKDAGHKPSGVVETLKQQLLEKNQNLGALQDSLYEAESDKKALLLRINELLARAQEEKIVAKAPPAALAATPPAPAAAQPRGQETRKVSAEKNGDVKEEEEEEEEEEEGPGGRIVDATLGVGVVFKSDRRGFYKIIEVVQGGAAHRSRSVKVGDVLLVINGGSAKNLTPKALSQILVGPEGTWVELGLQRVDDEGLLYVTNVSLRRGEAPMTAASASAATSPPKSQQPPVQDASVQCGVGITFGRDRKGFFVVKALAPGGPAAATNDILVHDTLVAVDGQSVKGARYDQLAPLILGPEGSLIVITLRRAGNASQIVDVHLRRARITNVGRTRSKTSPPAAPRPRSSDMHTLKQVPEEDAKYQSEPSPVHAPPPRAHAAPYQFQTERAQQQGRASTGASSTSSPSSMPPSSGSLQKCGIGLTFRVDEDGFYRVVEKDSSVANIAGIASVEVGDALVRVEGRLVKGMGHAQLGLLVLGPMGSQLTVLMRSAYDGADYPLILNRVKPVLDSSRLQQPPSTSSRGSRDSLKSNAPRGCGVGATFEYRGGLHYVASVSVGGSAYHSEKLHCGDCVLQVNGQSVSILSDEELDDLIAGPEGSYVSLLIRTPTKNIHEIRLVRTAAAGGVKPEKTGFATADGWTEDDQGLDGFNSESTEIIGIPSTAPTHRRMHEPTLVGSNPRVPSSESDRTVERMMT